MSVDELLRMVTAKQKAFEDAKLLYQDRFAPDFNPFDLLRPNEVRLSSVLAWLLDPKGTHGQGGHFLGLFLDRLDTGWQAASYDRATIRTEVVIEEGRLDITVRFGNKLVIIENKPWATEGENQLRRYLNYIDRQPSNTSLLVYLTANGLQLPVNVLEDEITKRSNYNEDMPGQFRCWNYSAHVLDWLLQCRTECGADRVSTFIKEFARYIEREFAGVTDLTMQEKLVEEIVDSPASVASALQLISAADKIRGKLCQKLQDGVNSYLNTKEWTSTWNEPIRKPSYTWYDLTVDFGVKFDYHFRMEFDTPSFTNFWYGAYPKDVSQPPSNSTKMALQKSDIPGNTHKVWSWRKQILTEDHLFLSESYRGTPTDLFVAMADGSMAKIVIEAVQRFHDVMLTVQSNGGQSREEDT